MSDPVSTQALLATLSFGLPRQSRQLPKEAKKVEDENRAQHGVAKVSVYYFQQQDGKTTIDALSELKSHNNLWKKNHERLTIPWLGSARLLAGAIIPQYLNMRAEMERVAPEVANRFFEVHPDWEVTGPNRMGAFFDRTDFPSLDECRERISWENLLTPLPESAQWQRIALINPEHAAMEEARHNEAVNRARREAHQQTWTDLLGHFNHIIEVLSKDRTRIHETLIGNLNQMLDLVPAYGPLFNDQDLLRAAAAAKETLGTINIEDLRADPALRSRAVTNARDLLATFGELGRRRIV